MKLYDNNIGREENSVWGCSDFARGSMIREHIVFPWAGFLAGADQEQALLGEHG